MTQVKWLLVLKSNMIFYIFKVNTEREEIGSKVGCLTLYFVMLRGLNRYSRCLDILVDGGNIFGSLVFKYLSRLGIIIGINRY